MSEVSVWYERLESAVRLVGDDAAIRFTTLLQPSTGPGARLMPPSAPSTEPGSFGYLSYLRYVDGHEATVVELDTYQSQANRVEEALLWARDEGVVRLPLFEMEVEADPWRIRLTSLDFPHRYADAYLRDSTIDGVPFDKTDIGKRLRVAEPMNATALYEYDPVSAVLGAWNSHRKGRQPKFARCYRSEVIGIDPHIGVHRGGRLDPLNLQGSVRVAADGVWDFVGATESKQKGSKLSEQGHGNALSDQRSTPGGVSVKEVRRLAGLSFAALSRLRFGDPKKTAAGRVALAALAILGDRLAFGAPSWVFRSGCELTVIDDRVSWEARGGGLQPWDITRGQACELFDLAVRRARDVGLTMSTDTIAIEPLPGLRKAIDHALLKADAGEQ